MITFDSPEYELYSTLLKGGEIDAERFMNCLSQVKDINAEIDEGKTLLSVCVTTGRIQFVKALIQAGANVDFDPRHPEVDPPLSIAGDEGQQEIFDYLAPLTNPIERIDCIESLTHGILRKACDLYNDSGLTKQGMVSRLIQQLEEEFIHLIREAISSDIDINNSREIECPFLWIATLNGYINAVQLLIMSGASVNLKNWNDDWSPLMVACSTHKAWLNATMEYWNEPYSNQLEISRLLLSSGADVNATAKDGFTPLLAAAIAGDLETLSFLHSRGANIYACTTDELNSLMISASIGSLELLKYLLANGINLHDKNVSGMTALEIAAAQGQQLCFDYLAPISNSKERKAAISVLPQGLKIIHGEPLKDILKRLESEHFKLINRKIKEGENLNAFNESGCTLLWLACLNGHLYSVRALAEAGADVNLANQHDGWTPLMIACETNIPWGIGTQAEMGEHASKQLDIVGSLLESGADVNLAGNNGCTPLMIAVECMDTELVSLLLNFDADIDSIDILGRKAIDYLTEPNHQSSILLNNYYQIREVLQQ